MVEITTAFGGAVLAVFTHTLELFTKRNGRRLPFLLWIPTAVIALPVSLVVSLFAFLLLLGLLACFIMAWGFWKGSQGAKKLRLTNIPGRKE